MEPSTKQEIVNWIMNATRAAVSGNWEAVNAQAAAEQLNISRNLASQYLNQLVHENVLLKINSRPVASCIFGPWKNLRGFGSDERCLRISMSFMITSGGSTTAFSR